MEMKKRENKMNKNNHTIEEEQERIISLWNKE